MFQILFGLGTDSTAPSEFANSLRTLFATFDKVVYTLIEVMYSILFNIADQDIVSVQMVKDFYGRVQLILGVIMIFKLSISVLQVVINPDLMTDQKKGLGKIITRVLVALAMFTLIIPLNIPSSAISSEHSYNQYLNDDGLLFGTLYSLQYRILHSNVLAKLIIGTEDAANYDIENAENVTNARKNGSILSSYLIKGFVSVNLKQGYSDEGIKDSSNYMCSNDETLSGDAETILETMSKVTLSSGLVGIPVQIIGKIVDVIKDDKTDANKAYAIWSTGSASDILDMVNISCTDGYAFSYFPIVSTICGLIILVIFIGFCIDIAIRTLKLVVLRILSPIAIISYVDPQSAEKGAFANWLKLLVSTYIDLFVRLSIVYFAMFIVLEIIKNGLNLRFSSSIIGMLSMIIIIIGIFYFARMAPKFITDALGIKGMMSNIGLSSILSGVGTITAGGSLREAGRNMSDNARNYTDALREGKQGPRLLQAFEGGQDAVAKRLTGDNNATYRGMRRAAADFRRNIGSTDYADRVHNDMFAANDQAVRSEATLRRIQNGAQFSDLTDSERDRLSQFAGKYENEYRKRHGNITGDVLTDDILRDNDLLANIASDSYVSAKNLEAGQAKTYDDFVQTERKKAGMAEQLYDKYRAKSNNSNATFEDLGSVFNDSSELHNQSMGSRIAQGLRDIAAMPGNEMRNARENRRGRAEARRDASYQRQQDSNDRNRNRNRNGNGNGNS